MTRSENSPLRLAEVQILLKHTKVPFRTYNEAIAAKGRGYLESFSHLVPRMQWLGGLDPHSHRESELRELKEVIEFILCLLHCYYTEGFITKMYYTGSLIRLLHLIRREKNENNGVITV